MIIILTFFGIYILFFGKNEGINRYLGGFLIILGFIFLLLSTTDLIPRQTVITFQKIIPMKNDLDPSEIFYFYDDDKTVVYYTLHKKVMKFPSNIVKVSETTSDSFVHIISNEFVPMWLYVLGFKKSVTTEVTINIKRL